MARNKKATDFICLIHDSLMGCDFLEGGNSTTYWKSGYFKWKTQTWSSQNCWDIKKKNLDLWSFILVVWINVTNKVGQCFVYQLLIFKCLVFRINCQSWIIVSGYSLWFPEWMTKGKHLQHRFAHLPINTHTSTQKSSKFVWNKYAGTKINRSLGSQIEWWSWFTEHNDNFPPKYSLRCITKITVGGRSRKDPDLYVVTQSHFPFRPGKTAKDFFFKSLNQARIPTSFALPHLLLIPFHSLLFPPLPCPTLLHPIVPGWPWGEGAPELLLPCSRQAVWGAVFSLGQKQQAGTFFLPNSPECSLSVAEQA